MSAYALPIFFPLASIERDHNISISDTFNNESTATHIPKQKNSHLEQLRCESNFSSGPCYRDVDVVVNSANIDPRSLLFPKKQNHQSSYRNEEAVTFELIITFNGRKYTAKRPFHRLRKLYAELVKECEKLGMVMPELPKSDCNGKTCQKTHVMFPIARSGFSMIQSMMSSYAPIMEGWFSQVCQTVPTSPSLTRFLWEPLNNENNTNDGRLSSIQEEDEDDYDNE